MNPTNCAGVSDSRMTDTLWGVLSVSLFTVPFDLWSCYLAFRRNIRGTGPSGLGPLVQLICVPAVLLAPGARSTGFRLLLVAAILLWHVLLTWLLPDWHLRYLRGGQSPR